MTTKDRVQLFPGVTVSPLIAAAVKYDLILPEPPKSDGVFLGASPLDVLMEKGDLLIKDGTSPTHIDAGDSLFSKPESYVAGRRWDRSFGPAHLHWRNEGYEESRHLGNVKSHKPIPPLETLDEATYQPKTNGRWGTNNILEYLGLNDGAPRNNFLRQFNGDYMDGAKMVREAFTVAAMLGFMDRYQKSPEKRMEVFSAIAQYVHRHGASDADLVLTAFGLDSMPQIAKENYSPLVVGGNVRLTPAKDIGAITMEIGSLHLMSRAGHGLLNAAGYVLKPGSLPVYSKQLTI